MNHTQPYRMLGMVMVLSGATGMAGADDTFDSGRFGGDVVPVTESVQPVAHVVTTVPVPSTDAFDSGRFGDATTASTTPDTGTFDSGRFGSDTDYFNTDGYTDAPTAAASTPYVDPQVTTASVPAASTDAATAAATATDSAGNFAGVDQAKATTLGSDDAALDKFLADNNMTMNAECKALMKQGFAALGKGDLKAGAAIGEKMDAADCDAGDLPAKTPTKAPQVDTPNPVSTAAAAGTKPASLAALVAPGMNSPLSVVTGATNALTNPLSKLTGGLATGAVGQQSLGTMLQNAIVQALVTQAINKATGTATTTTSNGTTTTTTTNDAAEDALKCDAVTGTTTTSSTEVIVGTSVVTTVVKNTCQNGLIETKTSTASTDSKGVTTTKSTDVVSYD